jgi:hypothetical protein
VFKKVPRNQATQYATIGPAENNMLPEKNSQETHYQPHPQPWKKRILGPKKIASQAERVAGRSITF